MTERLRDQQLTFRKAAITRVAGEVLADTDCRSFTMAQVAGRLATSKATLYRYFRSREVLVEAAIRQAGRHTVDDARNGTPALDGNAKLAQIGRLLAARCLNVPERDGAPLCCLVEVACPFLDRVELGSLFSADTSAWRGGSRVEFVDAVLALSAVVAARRKAENRKPTNADVDAIVGVLFPAPNMTQGTDAIP